MAAASDFYLADISVPDLEGIPSKRKSLGQFQGILERHIDAIVQDTGLADPSGDGGPDTHCNKPMLDSLDRDLRNLEVAYKKWNLRLDQLLAEDTNEENIASYKDKWKETSKKYYDTKALLIKTVSNIKKSPTYVTEGHGFQSSQRTNSGPIKPIAELKPFQLEKNSSPGQFQEWKRRFISFFSGSGLKHAEISVQHSYFFECLSPQLAKLLDCHIDSELSIFPNPEIPNDTSCMGVLQQTVEARFPLSLRRLTLFTMKQNHQSFTDYIARLRKASETADISNFKADDILSYCALSGCSDSDIIEEILKLSKTPNFDTIVKIGTNLEVSRSILKALPGTHQNTNRSFKISNRNTTLFRSKSKNSYRKSGFQKNKVMQVSNPWLEEMRFKKICTKCGKFKCPNMGKCPSASKICAVCKKLGHSAEACVSHYKGQNLKHRSVSFDAKNRSNRILLTCICLLKKSKL